jgi:hypothetical protein
MAPAIPDAEKKYADLEQFLQARLHWFRPVSEGVPPLSDQVAEVLNKLEAEDSVANTLRTVYETLLITSLPQIPKIDQESDNSKPTEKSGKKKEVA